MPFDVIRGAGVPVSHLPFSPATGAGGFVFVSGQASVDDAGAIVVDTFEGSSGGRSRTSNEFLLRQT